MKRLLTYRPEMDREPNDYDEMFMKIMYVIFILVVLISLTMMFSSCAQAVQ